MPGDPKLETNTVEQLSQETKDNILDDWETAIIAIQKHEDRFVHNGTVAGHTVELVVFPDNAELSIDGKPVLDDPEFVQEIVRKARLEQAQQIKI